MTKAVEASLGQPKYHFRLPWFARVQSDGAVLINGDSQASMVQELAYAAAARLNCWRKTNLSGIDAVKPCSANAESFVFLRRFYHC